VSARLYATCNSWVATIGHANANIGRASAPEVSESSPASVVVTSPSPTLASDGFNAPVHCQAVTHGDSPQTVTSHRSVVYVNTTTATDSTARNTRTAR